MTESLLPEAEIVFRVAAETHPGGAHAAIVAELDRLRSEVAALRNARSRAVTMAAEVVRATYHDDIPDPVGNRIRHAVVKWKAGR